VPAAHERLGQPHERDDMTMEAYRNHEDLQRAVRLGQRLAVGGRARRHQRDDPEERHQRRSSHLPLVSGELTPIEYESTDDERDATTEPYNNCGSTGACFARRRRATGSACDSTVPHSDLGVFSTHEHVEVEAELTVGDSE
jgi:hypothetical protein